MLDASDYRLLVESLPDAVIACGGDGRILLVNRAAEEMLGWTAAELAGRPLEALVPERQRRAHTEGFQRFFSTGQRRLAGRTLLLSALRRDGSEMVVELTIAGPIALEGGSAVVGSMRPAQQRLELERQRAQTRYLRASADAAARLRGRLDPEQAVAAIVKAVVDDFDADRAELWITDPSGEGTGLVRVARADDSGVTQSEVGTNPVRFDPSAEPALAEAARSRNLALWPADQAGGTVAAFPLLAGGELLGVLGYGAAEPPGLEAADALATFAAIAAGALNDAQILKREQAARIDAEGRKRRLQTILDAIPIGVLLAEGLEGLPTLANPAARQILGSALSSTGLDDFFTAFPISRLEGRDLEPQERPLHRALHDGQSVRETVRLQRPDGRELVLDLTATPLPGPEPGAVATFADMTDRLRLEAELASRTAQFKALLDNLPVGVAYFDRIGVCRACNGPARRVLGRTRREITGATAAELFGRTPALRDALIACIDGRRPHAEDNVPWTEDPSRAFDWRFEPLASGDPGKSRGALALMIDVTDRVAVERGLKEKAESAREASRRKTQFLSAVSHDLRTPVNALSLQAELLARLIEGRDDEDSEMTQLAADIRQVAANLIELINDLLDLSKLDSGMIDFRPSRFALEQFLEKTLAPLEAAASQKGLDFTWQVGQPGGHVVGDKVKLARVLTNLVSNAVKFTERGGIDVIVRATPEGGLSLSVRDTGLGIPEDQLERIFDEFAQLRNPERDRTKGTGLGLAICRRLVDGVGGRLTVSSRLGEGSTFNAVYPPEQMLMEETRPEPPEPKIPPEFAAAAGPGVNTAAEPILLVEDDANSRSTLERLLGRAGYSVETAPDGLAALEILERVRPCLVLLDLMMPGMEGGEVLRRIRSRPDWRDLKVILLTGDVITGRTADLMAMNIDGILPKPIDFKELLATVSRLVPRTAARS